MFAVCSSIYMYCAPSLSQAGWCFCGTDVSPPDSVCSSAQEQPGERSRRTGLMRGLVIKEVENWRAGTHTGTAVKSTGRLLRGCRGSPWKNCGWWRNDAARLKWIPAPPSFFLTSEQNESFIKWTGMSGNKSQKKCNQSRGDKMT